MSTVAYNIAIEDAACKIDEIWRKYKDSIEAPGCTELCAAVRSLKRGIKEVEPVSLSTSEDWHYVSMSGKGPFDHQKEGWFPTEALAKSHKASFRALDQQLMTIHPITEKERLSIIPVAPKYMQPHVSQMYEDYTAKYRDAKFEPMATELKDQDGHPVEMLVPVEPWPGGVTFDWHYVRLNNYGPNDGRASGWFPTPELAQKHVLGWPATMQEHMVVIPDGNPNAPFNDKKAPEQMHGSTERALKNFMDSQMLEEQGAKDKQWRDAESELKKYRAEIGAISKLLHGMPPHRGSLIARLEALVSRAERVTEAESREAFLGAGKWLFKEGMLVKKKSGSWWAGTVVGTYSTKQTPRGYCVQLATPGMNGPVQIYPEDALVPASPAELTNG